MQPDDRQPSFSQRINALNNWGLFLCRAFSAPIEVFLRGGFGERYLGLPALVGAGILLFWGTMWQGLDIRPMWCFLGAYLFMCALERVGTARRRSRNDACHSHYSGYPRLRWLLPWMRELTIKKWVETPVAFFAGVFLLPVSQPLGLFIMVASIAMHSHFTAADEYERRRAQELFDAYVDQKSVMERFRDLRKDQF